MYQTIFWNSIRFPFKRLFDGFIKDGLDMGILNYGTTDLIQKTDDVASITKFRLICLMNDSQ
jgi:hypothetical protein